MEKFNKCIVYAMTLFYNAIINKIPSRHIRKWFLMILGAKFGKKTYLFRRAEVLKPYELKIGERTIIGWFTLLDARGGLDIGNNVNISSYVKIITGSHDINSPQFEAEFEPVKIEDNVWIGSGAIILQNVTIGRGSVVAAGAVVTKDIEENSVVGGVPAKLITKRDENATHYIQESAMILH